MRKLAKPLSYVTAKDAAAFLRERADALEQNDDGQLVYILLDCKFARVAEIEHSLKHVPKRREPKRIVQDVKGTH